MDKPFWIVVSESRGPASHTYKHATQSAAIVEACRLCREHGGVFYVMEAQVKASRNDVAVTNLLTGDDIPF